ncbi:MAG: N-6 DNA methylase [Desulfobacca sp.]|nr:N-6 DNA methylase [Desulfobacca sp.]
MDEASRSPALAAIITYCQRIRQIRQDPGHHPETSLYGPLETLLKELASLFDQTLKIIPQYSLGGIGSPDFGIEPAGKSLAFLEAKEPDKDLSRLKGHDQQQLDRYLELPNLLLTNFWEMRLFQEGELVQQATLVPWECLESGKPYQSLLATHNLTPALQLLERFLTYSVPYITKPDQLCRYLARAARLVRVAVEDAMQERTPNSPLEQIYNDYREVLFFDLTRDEFADAYAQTLAYALLLARQATGSRLVAQGLMAFIDSERHRLLWSTLFLLVQPMVTGMIGWSIYYLIDLVNQVDPKVLSYDDPAHDPLLYFYEDFLAEYDPSLRKRRGIYYTPPAVVNFQTRVINRLLVQAFQKPYGLADQGVEILDPATGTGTYLVSALAEGCRHIRQTMGEAAVPQAASHLADHLHGFEILVGPYTVAHYRMATAIQEYGGQPSGRLPIYLTDTLSPSYGQPLLTPHFGFISDPFTEERQAADRIKAEIPIMVVLGNPPYGRGKAETGWLWDTLMEDFRQGVPPEYRGDLNNLAECYVYFYRWALWKLFEQQAAARKGILSFISNSRWLIGGAFGGMRQVFRRYFDRIYVIDLHGDSRAPLPAGIELDENVFDIQVGVAITICVADGSRPGEDAEVFYTGLWGSRPSKYEWLNLFPETLPIERFALVPVNGSDPFYPALGKDFAAWPDLPAIFRKKFSGLKTHRDDLVVAPTRSELARKITALFSAPKYQQEKIFHETPSRTLERALKHAFDPGKIIPYAYRPLDNQYLYNNFAYIDRPRDTLQSYWGYSNLCLATRQDRHGHGASVFLFNSIPDLNAYNGNSSHIFPLWNGSAGNLGTHNFNPRLLEGLGQQWGQEITPDQLFAFCYAVLGWEGYSLRFAQDLARSFPRVPFPRDYSLFQEGAELGQKLIAWHSFQERYPADGSITIQGSAATIDTCHYDPVTGRLYLANENFVAPVSKEAWEYVVSSYEVLSQWVKRRFHLAFTLELQRQLLEVIWALEQTVNFRPALNDFGERLLTAPHLSRYELGIES